MILDPARQQELLAEWTTERRMIVARIAEERGKLRDVEHRLKVFFAWEGDHG